MKIPSLISLVLAVVLVGCVGPLKRFSKSQDRVDRTKAALADNQGEQTAIGRDFTYAADQALAADPDPSRESQVAAEMTHRALLASGLPEAATAAELRQMVRDLISTNASLVAKGQRALAAKDAELERLQSQAGRLEEKLGAAEARLERVSQENAALAQKWVRLQRIAYFLVGTIVLLILLFLAIQILPIIFPELSAARSALRGVVSAVQHIREKLKQDNPDLASAIDGVLGVALPPNSRQSATVQQIKSQLGL